MICSPTKCQSFSHLLCNSSFFKHRLDVWHLFRGKTASWPSWIIFVRKKTGTKKRSNTRTTLVLLLFFVPVCLRTELKKKLRDINCPASKHFFFHAIWAMLWDYTAASHWRRKSLYAELGLWAANTAGVKKYWMSRTTQTFILQRSLHITKRPLHYNAGWHKANLCKEPTLRAIATPAVSRHNM